MNNDEKKFENVNYLNYEMDIDKKLDFLNSLFPGVVSFGKIDFEKLKFLLGNEENEKSNDKYGLNWEGKKNLFNVINSPTNKQLSININDYFDNFSNSNNIYLKGDNLEHLKLLQKSYYSKIDVIYIDPPYNTGKEFIYNDNFKETKDSFKEKNDDMTLANSVIYGGHSHTKWLNMMYPRLHLCRNLLKEDGLFFISIDDNEYAHLKDICDEIFGENNFICTFIWQHKSGGGNEENFISVEHEYIILYAKNRSYAHINQNEIIISQNEFNYQIEDKFYKLVPLVKWGAGENDSFKTLRYPIKNNIGEEYWPTKPNGEPGRWRKKPENCELIIWKENKFGFLTPYEAVKKESDTKFLNYRSILLNTDVGTTSEGTKELNNLLGEKLTNMFPKPVSLIKFLINLHPNKDALILDFFSGSATTAQATIELNLEDSGNRKFIMVQLPEKTHFENYETICNIGINRIFKVFQEKNINPNLRIFELEPKQQLLFKNEQNKKDIVYKHENLDLFVNDLTFKIENLNFVFNTSLRYGLTLDFKYQEIQDGIFIVNEKYLLITKYIEPEEINKTSLSIFNIFIKDSIFESDDNKKSTFIKKLETNGFDNERIFIFI